ncbi:phosphotransferase [Kribbella sp. CA-293567]|uniref:phosphotransferase n=1 Tax=Kribbella sp. CA-293567 TaxID=3002436 RepID=UPI0022DE11F5|nr:phosphotransferase [Kribbella sp. CA-293567]WBQ04096.1 phosphotransferase [Kribbella sp. CA-293567]
MTEDSAFLELLTGGAAGEILAAAVGAGGGELLSWRADQVDHHGGGTTVAYRAEVLRDSVVRSEVFCATAGGALPDGVAILGDDELQVGVWAAAADPLLPGMRAAMNPAAVSALFENCGLGKGEVGLKLLSYRPLRRAVVEATGALGRLYLKVVPPAKVEALHDRHQLLTRAGVPAPKSLGWSDDGLLVLENLPGKNLRSVLRSGGPLPDPSELVRVLDALPAELLDAPRRTSWLERTEYYARSVGNVVPELAASAAELAAKIVAESNSGPIVPVHSDFYEAQVFVDARGSVTGLLDVDTAGPGDRLDDLACLVGHLDVLAQVLPRHASAIGAYSAHCLSTFDRHVDPRQLRLRVASVVLSLATGPHRVQEAGWRQATRERLLLAESWVEAADRVNRSRRLQEEGIHHVSNA